MITSEHEGRLALRVEVVGERGADQHDEDVARGGQEPQRVARAAPQPRLALARAARLAARLRTHLYVFHFLE